ncbi:MAG TPA: hypothetical protein VH879_07280 [Gemmatimonadales bacterium]|jgi:hypothetical protein
MRWLGILARIVGWLLTPLVAWAASFYGAWVLLKLTGGLENPRHTIYAAFAAALITAIVLLLIWLHLLRRSPKLRHSLHVDREGLPVLDDAEVSAQDRDDQDSASEGPS